MKDSHYGTVGHALIDTLAKGLGPDFTPETREAWLAAYSLLTTVMKAGAAEVEETAKAAWREGVPALRIERRTYRLQGGCSTN